MGGLCKSCMVLQAKADVSDKNGKKLSLNDQVYTHHITIVDTSRTGGMAPITPASFGSCAKATRSKRSPQSGGAGRGGMGFSMFIGKGNEADASIFAPLNVSSPIKSGYWFGKDDNVAAMAEIINYKTTPQEVYVTLDYEYLPVDGPRPSEYLDTGFGTIIVQQCGNINLRTPTPCFVSIGPLGQR
jgi:hypothetical protein